MKKEQQIELLKNKIASLEYEITLLQLKVNKKGDFESLLNTTINAIAGIHWWKDLNGVYQGCNLAMVEALGFSSYEDIIGKTDYELPWADQASTLIKHDRIVINTGTVQKGKEEIIGTKQGEVHTFIVSKAPLRDETNNIIGTVGNSIDVTALKHTQKALEIAKEIAKAKAEVANQAKTEFLENMRHDIRTPLSGIVGCAQLIQMQAGLPKKVTEFANDLVESSDALLEFLNKILESITVASGEIPLVKNKFNLKEALQQIIRLNKPQAVVKGLALSLDYDETIPAYLIGDSVRVQRIILELLTNALKYTDKGSTTVSARLMKNKGREVIVELRVSDTGIGIPRDKQHEVYNRFTRLTPSFKGIYSGTGLGLSVVKQFIEDLKGEIYIESAVGEGAQFICLIPFQKSLLVEERTTTEFKEVDGSIKRAVNEPLVSGLSFSNLAQVLIVEDNSIAIKAAQNILSELDCQTDFAMDGKTALEKIEKNRYDLILMDMGLPDDDGCEVTRRIRLKQWQRNPSVPIIGLTAHIEAEKKQRCLANGMNAVFVKPLTLEKASEIVSAFISRQSLAQQQKNIPKYTDDLNTVPVLDIERAVEIIGKKEIVNECLALLIGVLDKDLDFLQHAYKIQDWATVKTIIHKWKGGSSYCGASRLRQACQQLEAVLGAAELQENIEAFYQQLLEAVEKTKLAANQAIALE